MNEPDSGVVAEYLCGKIGETLDEIESLQEAEVFDALDFDMADFRQRLNALITGCTDIPRLEYVKASLEDMYRKMEEWFHLSVVLSEDAPEDVIASATPEPDDEKVI
jgi:ACT domain-containing protein